MKTKIQNKKYDLEERTSLFSEKIIELAKKVKKNVVTVPIISQLVRAGTSIGANYCEANGASSRKDFTNKIFICKKEAEETKHWLRMLSVSLPDEKEHLRSLWKEAQELTMIFQKITNKLRS